MKKLSNNGLRPVIAIAGNHDSHDRIEAPDVLARMNGILFFGYPNNKITKFEIEDGFKIVQTDEGFVEIELYNKEKLRLLLTPFASEQRLKKYFNKENDEKISDYLRQRWTQIANKYCDQNGVNIIVSHTI